MKEIMVIKDEQAIDEWNRTIAQFIDVDNKIYKAEFIKVPETFEELKELCKNIIGISFGKTGQTQDTEYISLDNRLYFYKDGTVDFGFDNLAYTITPARQWQIIKSLIGEE